jgi:hypothetical protein
MTTPEAREDDFVSKCNDFWQTHPCDLKHCQELYSAYIDDQCQKGHLRYKNGRNLKDGLEIVNSEKVERFDPVEAHDRIINQRVAVLKSGSFFQC